LFFTALLMLTVTNVLVTQITKLSALLLIRGRDAMARAAKPDAFPLTSVLVPLLHETDIAGALVKRLSRLTYPKSRLDVALVLEAGDKQTKDTLRNTELPAWMRVIEVPPGTVQTKPRAMNYAVKFCRGEIVGIYDAEDAPAPDQLERVVMAFQNAPPQVACVQAILDFYNARATWVSRGFAIEDASWFRVLLPGFTRMGFAVPLGGTSVFFRREALEKVKGWDAHNVTEDADLGIRLARYGYRTQLIDSVTREEANNRCWPWIKQRSRWIKGYMITYLVHMRHPSRLWHQLGARKFLGFHLIFLTSILQFTLAPMLWSFWLIAVGMSHPVTTILPDGILSLIVILFLSTELVSLLVGITAISLSPHTRLLPWVPTLSLYFPLGVAAAYKALYELIVNPFYWDKTMHGKSAPDANTNNNTP
jgi:cellulose synthase/poly-beta-1,6-N-acetylglucosamine synthase-like glycosyltransferase